MEDFEITVTGITDREYYQAARMNNRRIYGILAAAMVVICGIIMLATGNYSASAFLGPVVLYVIFAAALELVTRFSYKGQLSQFDPVVYGFDSQGWDVTADGQTVDVDWTGTVKLKKTKDCLFLFNEGASSNLLPKRLLTEEQMALLLKWFRESRKAARAQEKVQTQKEREQFREEHQDLRFGNRGPSWGPWKKK